MFKTRQEAIEAFEKQHGDDFIKFEGMNCNDYRDEDDGYYCAGYLIGSCRCNCGNRRVDIGVDGDDKTGYTAYAYAY